MASSSLPSIDPTIRIFQTALYEWSKRSIAITNDVLSGYSNNNSSSSNNDIKVNESFTSSLYPFDDMNPLMVACTFGDVEIVKYLITNGVNVNVKGSSRVIPQVTPLHLAARSGHVEIAKVLIKSGANANAADQYGFTPLHYAILTRNKEMVLLLIGNGSLALQDSKNGNNPLDVAKELGFTDIIDILDSKKSSELDPTVPQFRDWLCSLGAGQYLNQFIDAGYDLRFIKKQGITDADLDCVGIPMTKRGIRLKIMALYNLSDFYEGEDEEDEEEGNEEGDEEEEEEEDDDE